MKRQVILLPNETFELSPRAGGVWPGTSGSIWGNTPSLRLDEAWADDLNTTHRQENGRNLVICKGLVGFDPAPLMVTFDKITFSTAWDYSQNGPNQWYFPPDNAAGPKLTIYMIRRDGSTELDGTSYEIQGADIAGMNVNKLTDPDLFKLKTHTWEQTTHPDGGPWTLDDLNELKAGVRLNFTDGPGNLPFNPSGINRIRVRVPYFKVLLDVSDIVGDVANVRNSVSISMRFYRRPRKAIRPRTFAHRGTGSVGSRAYLSHSRGPGVTDAGWGQRRLERRAGLVLKHTIFPEQFKVADELLDLHDFACLGWAAYRINGPWSPELQGVAFVDKGAGFTHTRAQDAWSPRPGDGVLMGVSEDFPNVSEDGLAAQGGADESVCLYNFDLMQTGWSTVGSSGDFTASQDATVTMVEQFGFYSSAKLVYGGAGGAGGRERSLGALPYASGDFLHLDITIKNTSVPTPATQKAEWGLYRTGGGLAADEWWDNATRTWTTTITYNTLPSDGPFGQAIVDAIPLDAAGATSDPTYNIRIGRFSSNLTSVTFHGALVDAQHSGNTVAGARTPLVVSDTAITRVADVHTLANSAAAELWDYERGVAVVEAWPFWRAADLPTDAVRPLIHAKHATATYDALQFVAKTGFDDLIRFKRAVTGQGTFQLDAAISGIDITRAHVLRAWVRWLGADGWDQYAPYSVEVGYAVFLKSDNSLVGSGSALGLLSYTGPVATRDFVGIGTDGASSQLDGRVRMWETRRNPLHGVECVWRI